MLKYLEYNNLNMSDELAKIERCTEAELWLKADNKECLFILGMLFVNGVRIKILNENELDLDGPTKSYRKMPYVWSKIADDSFPKSDLSDVNNVLAERVENIKRLGVNIVDKIINYPIKNKIFLICPVRNATPEQRKWIEDFVEEKYNEGYNIHAPHLHTVQRDLFGGYTICKQNGEALASSEEIDIYYDQTSTGSVFDLGMAYGLHKPLRLLNREEIVFSENDPIDRLIESWPYNDRLKKMTLSK